MGKLTSKGKHIVKAENHSHTNKILKALKSTFSGVPVMAQWKQIQLGTLRLWVRSMALLSGLRIQRCCELWCRLAATAPIRPLAWEPPCVAGAALEKAKRQKINKKRRYGT